MIEAKDKFPEELTVEDIPDDLIIDTQTSFRIPNSDDSLEFHAARLLFLLRYAGGRKHKVIGRTKIAKMDFFIRYPSYLAKAIGDAITIQENVKPESPMIRYKYGPWDEKYYDIFALMVARGLISIFPSKTGDVFELTNLGLLAVQDLEGPDFDELVNRCKLVYERFKGMSGNQIKEYIYREFPEIVAKSLGEEIIK